MLLISSLALADTFVLVRDGAIMRAGQQQVKLVASEGAVVMRLMEDQGAQLVVAPLTDAARHCYTGQVDAGVELRVSVAMDDVRPVLLTDFTSADGAIMLRAGTHVEPGKAGVWTATVDGHSVALPIPVASVGYRYNEGTAWPGGTVRTARVATVGGESVTWPAGATVSQGEGPSTVTGRCLSLRGAVSEVAEAPISTSAAPSVAKPVGRFTVASGTVLTWADGTRAGAVTSDSVVTLGDPANPRVCAAVTLAGSQLRACMDKKAAVPVPVRPGLR